MWRAPEGPEGLAGLRDDAPSEARGADDSRAGHRPRAHKAAPPHGKARRHPQHLWATSNNTQHHGRAGRPRAHQAARPVNAYKNAHPEPGGRI